MEVIFPFVFAFVVSEVVLLLLLLLFVPELLFPLAEDTFPLLWIDAIDMPPVRLLLPLLFEEVMEPTFVVLSSEEVSSPIFGALLASQ